MFSSGSGKTGGRSAGIASRHRRAFTLVELLIVIVIIAVLVALGIGATASAMGKAKGLQCVSKMRSLGGAVLLFGNDHEGAFPRSTHSSSTAGEIPWTYAIAPYLGIAVPLSIKEWPANFERYYRCPGDRNNSVDRWSYALNVFYELNPDGDDYEGSPATWRRVQQVPRPARSILIAEPRSLDFADHFMCHLWKSKAGAQNALDHKRHGNGANYLFVDGHVETLRVEAVFSSESGVNLFNPSLAR